LVVTIPADDAAKPLELSDCLLIKKNERVDRPDFCNPAGHVREMTRFVYPLFTRYER
jgi:hypothetical protein